MSPAPTYRLPVSCMCGDVAHTFSVIQSALPLPTYLSSSDFARRTSGSLLSSYIALPGAPSVQNATAYSPSDSTLGPTVYFCSTCGTQVYRKQDGKWEVATGALQMDSLEGVVDVKGHVDIAESRDGGGSEFLPSIGGRVLERYLGPLGSEEAPFEWRSPEHSAKPVDERTVYAHCHCKGVEFWIHPPSARSRSASSGYADLLIPDRLGQSANPQNEPWWLPPPGKRFLAGTCACHSCRRSSGFEITCWAFVPLVDISIPSSANPGERVPFPHLAPPRDAYWGTLKAYDSRPDVTRAFCGHCGCSVFWNGHMRSTLIDIAVGMLDAPTGARAEGMLAWWPERVSYEEDKVNVPLIVGLEAGLKRWAERKGSDSMDVAKGEFKF